MHILWIFTMTEVLVVKKIALEQNLNKQQSAEKLLQEVRLYCMFVLRTAEDPL